LTRAPSHLRYSCPCVAERWGLCGWCSGVYNNNLEGSLPSELGLLTDMSHL